MKLIKWVNKTGGVFCWATATRNNWSADRCVFVYFGQRVKFWYSQWLFVGHIVNVSIIEQSFDYISKFCHR